MRLHLILFFALFSLAVRIARSMAYDFRAEKSRRDRNGVGNSLVDIP